MIRSLKRIVIIFLLGFSIGLNINNNSTSEFDSNKNSIILVNSFRGGGNRKYPPNFDRNFHRILRKEFPDLKRRVEFEKSQLEFYNSARLKFYRAPVSFTMEEKMRMLLPEERNAINYFTGQGFYRSQQDYRTPPNLFDTRESFLIKMHDKANRDRVLKILNESD